jgi:hypothetical protein
MYDSRVGRWFARDSKESKYPSTSTYNFALNNPILYIDVDGEDIFIPIVKEKSSYASSKYDHLKRVGDDPKNVAFTPFREQDVDSVLKEIQKGSNDKLYLKSVYNHGVKIGYTVEIDQNDCANDAFSYPEGSSLVKDLITDKKHTTSIAKSNIKEGQSEGHGQNVYLPDENSLVNFNPNREADDEHEGILNSDGKSYGRPAFIGLYHEFGHALDHKNKVPLDVNIDIYNPDSYPKYQVVTATTEELSNRVRENKIRLEHKNDKIPVKQRATPKVVPIKKI